MGTNKTFHFTDERETQDLNKPAHSPQLLRENRARIVLKPIISIILCCLSWNSASNPEVAYILHSHPYVVISVIVLLFLGVSGMFYSIYAEPPFSHPPHPNDAWRWIKSNCWDGSEGAPNDHAGLCHTHPNLAAGSAGFVLPWDLHDLEADGTEAPKVTTECFGGRRQEMKQNDLH